MQQVPRKTRIARGNFPSVLKVPPPSQQITNHRSASHQLVLFRSTREPSSCLASYKGLRGQVRDQPFAASQPNQDSGMGDASTNT